MDRLAKLLKILAVEPDDAFTLYGVAQEYTRRAQDGDAARAIEFYDKCLAADPMYCYAYYHKAKVQAEDGNAPGAIATIKSGLEVAKTSNDGKAQSELSSLLDSIT
jgi:tetratricopeptide (TPR) repeat protein